VRSEYPPSPPFAASLRSVGITGTNGKTTTTTWIGEILRRVDPECACVTTIGTRLGETEEPPVRDHGVFLDAMRRTHDRGGRYVAVETTSAALGRGFATSWPWSVGVFTNLSHDHLDTHHSPEHYLASKAQLFVNLPPGSHAVLCADDPSASLIAEVLAPEVSRWWYGTGESARSLRLEVVSVKLSGTSVRLHWGEGLDGPEQLDFRAVGEVFALDAAAAILSATALGLDPAVAVEALSGVEAPRGRFETVLESPRAIVDYAHTPDALARMLATARGVSEGRVVLVFGAGGDRDPTKRRAMGEAARAADRVFLTNDNPRGESAQAIADAIRAGLANHPDCLVELDRRTAIRRALEGADSRDLIVIAGRGHEGTQSLAGYSRPLDDAEEIRRWHTERAGP
jgi:UDP-N-acetylmuramoyl-L-alanyl-D-glutamate--2,6-diaminopimelate ligase